MTAQEILNRMDEIAPVRVRNHHGQSRKIYFFSKAKDNLNMIVPSDWVDESTVLATTISTQRVFVSKFYTIITDYGSNGKQYIAAELYNREIDNIQII